MSTFKLFSGSANPEFAKKVGDYLGMCVSDATLNKFSDGEISVQITQSVRGQDVYIIQPTCAPTNDNLMELLIMIDALKRSSAKSINAVIPYYGYARQDRKAAPRVPISAKLVADLLEKAGINRVVTIDLHAAQIQGFFNIPADNLFGSILFVNYIKSKNLKNPIIASPDIGGVARARQYADKLGYDLVIVDKKREKANESQVMNIIGDVKGKDVILVDDMVDTAGTLVKAAEVLKEKGANSVMACCTHGVLSGPAYERVANGVLDELVISDTIPTKKNAKKITVLTASSIIGEAIRRIHNNESVNSIFNN
ncbi:MULTISPECIES: ribose-phosphate pyrophosphokinase [Aliarcobacter]|jgi:ribose-phosphate pyrophosphokinase|uniref:Ribose-phosphate pyrophosphokinase n=2 Tax=Arcobacteraceae TaxID=2808963 RepID=A0AAU0P2L7_9BACT|nr:ribose-phosphate pyrophosphokinase [Aliarcobacter cryaerophilus]WNL16203.1 ribose-phosphate pyrophosphokinase [Arcobacter sp. AZ-2023]WPD03320.1 ribose-phosphate pyrophosphokinase [Arcobacter sp. DSM 115972]MCT7406314.1 ribose-phosphate pyrophosphokinase [Aliarcobacter cryaerophilus]MCT7464078.1 ribose-phosphate pyrophosphokinase [Aliarcobacter cryaerophilus]MCT7486088.1 ribose-phosphate pyrophosphokinase [Aliarcobacter cryaerophilus]